MPRWRELPEELDPQVREFTGQLRRLVERGGMSVATVADRTGYSKTSWDRYLNGRLLPPRGAVEALAEATGTDVAHLTTLWELAERAWSRSEMRHDVTMEAIRVAQARAALGEFGPPAQARRTSSNGHPSERVDGMAAAGAAGPVAPAPAVRPAPPPLERLVVTPPSAVVPSSPPPASAAPSRPPAPPAGDPERPAPPQPPEGQRRRTAAMFVAGVVGAILVVASGVLLFGADEEPAENRGQPSATPSTAGAALPSGVRCAGKDCTGKNPETMGCGGQQARTTANATVGDTYVEVRYSEVCGAAWARITRAAPGDSVQVSAAGKNGGGARTQSADVNADGDAYTQMLAAASAAEVKACATLADSTTGCTRPVEASASP
ncbi:XRE family transcriptional regulator [Streptomyces sp. LX-29]|uniref:helix-turn-helix domain-containing protein n=1 Tax=Streptomyces sp. LX-29 TaxID=2900152 RepID=UPI00240E435F|nr:XRE family transcriptional regulator [Streptomyces sp. LX-29]WFB08953.1 XRE family transcriptional regulator [Streptomyces sp. LX-29]